MSDQTPENGQLFDAAAIAEAESAQWVVLRMQETVRAICPISTDEQLQQQFMQQFQRHHTRRRFLGMSLLTGTGIGGLAWSADALFDVEWFELFNNLLNWFGRPVLFRLTELSSTYRDWLS